MNRLTRPYLNTYPQISEGVYIDKNAVVIGKVHLAKDVSVWPMAVIRGDVNEIHIGEATNIQDAAVLHVVHDGPYKVGGIPLHIGRGVTIGHQAVLHACTIEDYCLIGISAIILDGAHIEHHVMVGAGSLVPPGKRLETGGLYLGNPVRRVRELSETEIEQLEYSSAHYVRLKNHYLETTS